MKNMTDIIWYDSIDSTNKQAKRLLSGLPAMSVIAAREQTAGRGQRGNTWKSEAGSNLTFSIVMRFGPEFRQELPANCQFVISEAVALGIKDYLGEENVRARIKWPNDIYAGDRKICGILIENTVSGERITSCIAGAGLNLNQKDFPAELPNPVSLTMLTGKEYDVGNELLKAVARICSRLEEAFRSPHTLREAYLGSMYRKNEMHSYTDCADGSVFKGIIRGISDTARLMVETEGGKIKEFSFKEIGYLIGNRKL